MDAMRWLMLVVLCIAVMMMGCSMGAMLSQNSDGGGANL